MLAADTLKRLLEQSAANKAKNAKAIAVSMLCNVMC